MRLRKSQVFDSRRMFPAMYQECRKYAMEQGYKYIDFNGMVFNINETSPEFKNAICLEKDLI